MAGRLSSALILVCAALAVAPAAQAAGDLHRFGDTPDPATGEDALRLAKRITSGQGVETGRELTPVLKVLAAKYDELSGADRRRADRYLARPTQGQANPGEATYTTAEQAPVCSAHFCVHYVATTADAPPGGLSYVNAMLNEFENVYNVENVQLGWRTPRSRTGRPWRRRHAPTSTSPTSGPTACTGTPPRTRARPASSSPPTW